MKPVETHEFSNGLRLVLERLPGCKSVGVAVGYPAGGHTEKIEVSGISHYLEHMIFKGTKTIKKVDAAFERLGAYNNAFTGVDATVYVAECPKANALKTLKLWLQLLSEALIEKQEFEREKGVILSEYFITEDNLEGLVGKNASASLFKGHPLATTVIGTEDSIKAITHEIMLNYFHHWYNSSNAVIWISGDLTMNRIVNCVEQQALWTEEAKSSAIPFKPFEPKGPSNVELKRQTKLAQIGLALSSPTSTVEERASLQILGSMFSAGQSSILRRKLVLEGEFTSNISTEVAGFREAGMFFTTFAVTPNRIAEVLNVLAETMNELRENAAKFKKDFENAQSHAAGSFCTDIDRRMMWRTLLGTWETLRRGPFSWTELITSFESLSFNQFRDKLKDIIRPERTALVLAGDITERIAQKMNW